MFGPAGTAYVYFTYGNHWMFNVVAGREDAAAVLIRAAEPIEGLELIRSIRRREDQALLNGPGKLCSALEIDSSLNGADLFGESGLRLEWGANPGQILVGPRIGIRVGTELRWRFADSARLRWVSRPIGSLAVP